MPSARRQAAAHGHARSRGHAHLHLALEVLHHALAAFLQSLPGGILLCSKRVIARPCGCVAGGRGAAGWHWGPATAHPAQLQLYAPGWMWHQVCPTPRAAGRAPQGAPRMEVAAHPVQARPCATTASAAAPRPRTSSANSALIFAMRALWRCSSSARSASDPRSVPRCCGAALT